ncbi:MAG: flagellar hook assembly protein FlgD [Rhodobacteraceae bacterium]|nr:flagellar hook assembly protein FlgD [Paracoccaceae bacterium]
MDIMPTSLSGPQTVTQPKPAFASTDFETFLKMLTTQLQNQDPLNPIDSADYAVQLATFSGVEQAVRTNQLLESMQAQFGLLGMAQLTGWVGQEARVAAPVHMDGTPVTLAPTPAAAADRAVLVVADADGTTVSREDIPVSTEPYQWLGADAAGDRLAVGTYALSLESYVNDTLLSTTAVEAYVPILEVRGGAEGSRLVLRGGVEVPATSVTALRVP